MRQYLYHYHTTTYIKETGQVRHDDGCIEVRESRLKTNKDYDEMRKHIAKATKQKPTEFNITSLTLL